jgi:hypothetical protein
MIECLFQKKRGCARSANAAMRQWQVSDSMLRQPPAGAGQSCASPHQNEFKELP